MESILRRDKYKGINCFQFAANIQVMMEDLQD